MKPVSQLIQKLHFQVSFSLGTLLFSEDEPIKANSKNKKKEETSLTFTSKIENIKQKNIIKVEKANGRFIHSHIHFLHPRNVQHYLVKCYT